MDDGLAVRRGEGPGKIPTVQMPIEDFAPGLTGASFVISREMAGVVAAGSTTTVSIVEQFSVVP